MTTNGIGICRRAPIKPRTPVPFTVGGCCRRRACGNGCRERQRDEDDDTRTSHETLLIKGALVVRSHLLAHAHVMGMWHTCRVA